MAIVRNRHPSQSPKADGGAARRWRIRSITAYVVLIGVAVAGYALVILAFEAAIKSGT